MPKFGHGNGNWSKTKDSLYFKLSLSTVFLSFLERERDRDFENVSDSDLVPYDRFIPFTVPGRF